MFWVVFDILIEVNTLQITARIYIQAAQKFHLAAMRCRVFPECERMTSWWFQSVWKICTSQIGSFTQASGWTKKVFETTTSMKNWSPMMSTSISTCHILMALCRIFLHGSSNKGFHPSERFTNNLNPPESMDPFSEEYIVFQIIFLRGLAESVKFPGLSLGFTPGPAGCGFLVTTRDDEWHS